MSDDYRIWLHRDEKGACDLLTLEGFRESYLLKEGVPLGERWPSDVTMDMNPDHPDDMRLLDSLFNIHSVLVLSEPLREFLASRLGERAEFLPVRVRDHKGKAIDRHYHILNLTHHLDCLDAEASGAEESLAGGYDYVDGIVLTNTDAIGDTPLFRLQGFGIPTLVSAGFAKAIDAEGFSGIAWGTLDEFTDSTW